MKSISVTLSFILLLTVHTSANYYRYPCRGIGDLTALTCDKGKCPGTAICDKSFDMCCCGNTPFNCFVEPCLVAKCPNFPRARCFDEFCEGCCCEARFFLGYKEVTDKC